MGEQGQARPTMADRLADTAAPSRNGAEPPTRQEAWAWLTETPDHREFVKVLLAYLPMDPEACREFLYQREIKARCALVKREAYALYRGYLWPALRRLRDFDEALWERELEPALRADLTLAPPETLTALLDADIPTPLQLFQGLMHEGMLLFGGKSKRGKSWLMFDLAIALAVGRSGFRHYGCPEARPVLYLALEDGRARLQSRARAIQPNLMTADTFHLRYSFPSFGEGAVELLAQEIARYHYGLVIVDVLAKLEQPAPGGREQNYHDVYAMFQPLQELRKQHPFCLTMLTHLRKQEADDVFDNLLGSVAYQGAQDVLWVLERKPKEEFAFLHIRDKDAEDQTIALRFTEGHWEYIGEGEEYEVTRDQRKIMRILWEERQELSIQALMKAASFPEAKYGYLRKLLLTMVSEDLIHRTRRGHYSATVRGIEEMVPSDENDVPF